MKKNSDVLIVDDNYFSSVALQSLIEQYSLEVDMAFDSADAIEVVEQRLKHDHTTDKFIFIEQYLLNIYSSGFKTIRKIRDLLNHQAPDLEEPFIALVSNDYDQVTYKEAMAAGADELVSKPIFKPKLLQLFIKANVFQKNRISIEKPINNLVFPEKD